MSAPMFGKRHYEVVASILHNNLGIVGRDDLINSFVSTFRCDNPLFDEGKFKKYVETGHY